MLYPIIENRMKELDISYRRLAKMMDISSASMCRKLNGKAPFLLKEAFKMRDLLFGDWYDLVELADMFREK